MEIPPPDEVRSILEACDPRFRAFVALCAFAGLRLGEAVALKVGDVAFLCRQIHVRSQVHVRRQVQRLGAGEIEIRSPKYSSERIVAVPDARLELLSEHVTLGLANEWLFSGVAEVPPHQNTVGHTAAHNAEAGRRRGCAAGRPAPFFASGLAASGCDAVAVQRAPGTRNQPRR